MTPGSEGINVYLRGLAQAPEPDCLVRSGQCKCHNYESLMGISDSLGILFGPGRNTSIPAHLWGTKEVVVVEVVEERGGVNPHSS